VTRWAAIVSLAAVLASAASAAPAAPASPAPTPPSLAPKTPLPGRTPTGDGGPTALPELGELAVVFTGLALVPAALVMMTSFTRIVIVLSFVRRALTTQNIPPNIAVVGLALFLTLFTMAPTLSRINEEAFQPYLSGKLTFQPAVDRGFAVVRNFMLHQTDKEDLRMFLDFAKTDARKAADVPMHVAIPAFAISEFRTAFEMGCLLFIPFLLIDLVIAGILLSAGMMMLPPIIVSLPFKIILFVLVDGWAMLSQSLVNSFY
jgi:flagellar biosynthetic protein FliP